MPTYEYICRACNHEWEAHQSIKDAPLKKCPACRKLKAKRQISLGTGFILKGSGWYSDLYSSSSAPSATDGDGASTASDTGTDSPAKKDDGGSSAGDTSTTTKGKKSKASKSKDSKASKSGPGTTNSAAA